MYKEVNTGTNLPAQIDLYATDGDEYKFLCIAKGGGSANKTYLYRETKALITPAKLKNYLVEKMRTLGTAACPPYHIAFVIGGTSAEATLKTVKLASTKYYDGLPTEGNEHGGRSATCNWSRSCCWRRRTWSRRAVRRQILCPRYPRDPSAASRRFLPGRDGVSCSADRNIKAKINRDGIWIEKLESNPGNISLSICAGRGRRSGEGKS